LEDEVEYTIPKLPTYVPEPEPASTDYLIGAHYFPGWKSGSHHGWDAIADYPDRQPLLGTYEEGNPEVTDWEIKWCREHGIQFFVYCWYRDRGNVGYPVTPADARLGHAIHDGLFNARFGNRFRFTIMWENYKTRGMVASIDDLMDNLLPFWIDQYFTRDNYLVVDNKPVLFVYHIESMLEHLDGKENATRAVDLMRHAVQQVGFNDLILMAEHRSPETALLYLMRDCGFDSSFAYCWHPDHRFPTEEQAIHYQLEIMHRRFEDAILPFIPTASMGWDPWPWRSDNPATPWVNPDTMLRWILSPNAWRYLLEQVKLLMDAHGITMLLLDNWNEWAEGHYIAPHAYGGFKYLQAVREVFTKRDNLPDYRSPQQLGMGPYTIVQS
jgi:hypothetical protein